MLEINKLNSVFIFPTMAKIKQDLLTSPKILTFEVRNLRVDIYFIYLKTFLFGQMKAHTSIHGT